MGRRAGRRIVWGGLGGLGLAMAIGCAGPDPGLAERRPAAHVRPASLARAKESPRPARAELPRPVGPAPTIRLRGDERPLVPSVRREPAPAPIRLARPAPPPEPDTLPDLLDRAPDPRSGEGGGDEAAAESLEPPEGPREVVESPPVEPTPVEPAPVEPAPVAPIAPSPVPVDPAPASPSYRFLLAGLPILGVGVGLAALRRASFGAPAPTGPRFPAGTPTRIARVDASESGPNRLALACSLLGPGGRPVTTTGELDLFLRAPDSPEAIAFLAVELDAAAFRPDPLGEPRLELELPFDPVRAPSGRWLALDLVLVLPGGVEELTASTRFMHAAVEADANG